ncbi:TetR/AcrR family transcriptional regulator [Rhodococcus jostii]|uniref:Regulatory protein, tetR family n=1 Tax=Rhodococcus jostii TaxID=132919 RepID=A0A1H5C2K1_RHOJO|nr:TetR/AcrR family transcriptional regulator [Rhodococcus jostii]SED60845.1 regulatory protein, tetR family [Rhodococcus jostii]
MAGATGVTESTRERMILTAERLFGERGIGAVSLREVGTAAGQRNTAAVQYHFGDKDALVAAIFEHRMTGINEERLQMLAAMHAQGQDSSLRSLLEAFVYPLVAGTAEADSHYGRFLVQLTIDPRYRVGWDWDAARSLRLVWQGIHRCLAPMPGPTIDERLRMLSHVVLHTVADHESAGGSEPSDLPPTWAVGLVDAAEGLLSAPASAPGQGASGLRSARS